MTEKPYIDFYESKNIIPVHQDISDLGRHMIRRNALYYQLNLVPGWLSGRSVIEFGPGTGDNAIHTSSLSLSKYVLVDGNSESIKEVRSRVKAGSIHANEIEVHHCLSAEFHTNDRFDLVLCEGLVPNQQDSSAFLRHMASFCNVGGVVVTTTVGAASCLADVCRHILKPFFTAQTADFWQQVDLAVEFFRKDLETLQGMSRCFQDWVLDNIMQDWVINPFFPFDEAIRALQDNFIFHGSSPNFFQDFRWYKSIHENDYGFNRSAIEQYYQKIVPLLLDYRVTPENTPAVSQIDGMVLEQLCKRAYEVCYMIRSHNDLRRIDEFLGVLSNIIDLISGAMPATSESLIDFCKGVQDLTNGIKREANFGDFRSFFGRAQQYLSMIRLP
jgi:ubiquinone/menaquinone biosynthesis C-methylase UbiE